MAAILYEWGMWTALRHRRQRVAERALSRRLKTSLKTSFEAWQVERNIGVNAWLGKLCMARQERLFPGRWSPCVGGVQRG